jgi:hypothetical protein
MTREIGAALSTRCNCSYISFVDIIHDNRIIFQLGNIAKLIQGISRVIMTPAELKMQPTIHFQSKREWILNIALF